MSVASEEAGFGPGWGSLLLLGTTYRWLRVKTQQSAVYNSYLTTFWPTWKRRRALIANASMPTATALNFKFSIVKKLLLRHKKISPYPSKILLTKQFVACQLNQARITIVQYAYRVQGLREKIFQGVRRSIPGPQIILGPPSFIGAHTVKSFLLD